VAHFFVSPKNFRGRQFFFDPSESRHLAQVLRKKAGDLIRVFNGEGIVSEAKILDASRPERVTGELLRTISTGSRSRKIINIHPALLKGPRFDWLLEKLTELSVAEIHPILTERTVVRFANEKAAGKIERWEKIILSAAKQCGRETFPRIYPAVSFQKAVSSLPKEDLNLILWEAEEKCSLAEALHSPKSSATQTINLIVGPEGGLSVQEAQTAILAGAKPVHLGERILRAETAAIAAAAYLILS